MVIIKPTIIDHHSHRTKPSVFARCLEPRTNHGVVFEAACEWILDREEKVRVALELRGDEINLSSAPCGCLENSVPYCELLLPESRCCRSDFGLPSQVQ